MAACTVTDGTMHMHCQPGSRAGMEGGVHPSAQQVCRVVHTHACGHAWRGLGAHTGLWDWINGTVRKAQPAGSLRLANG